jgi:DNA-binding NtrC family response regulator
VSLPPLRTRRDEIPLLFSYFGAEAAENLKRPPLRMTPRLRDFLLAYPYPGNIRELRNLIYRLSCLAGETADLMHLPADIRPRAAHVQEKPEQPPVPMSAGALGEARRAASDEAERLFLERGLREVGGTVAELARRCEMNRAHLQMLLKKHGLRSRDFRPALNGAA